MGDRRWLILVVLFIARCSLGYQFQLIGSSASFMEAELQIGLALIGTLIGLQSMPGVALSLPSGMLVTRFGDRAIFVSSLLLMTAGNLLMSTGGSVATLMAGRLTSGVGSVLFNVVLTKMLTDWFAGREIVFAMGTLMASWPCGIALGLIAQGQIAEHFGWRTGMEVTALFSLGSLVLLLVFYRPPQDAAGAAVQTTWWHPPARPSLRALLIAAIAWSCFNLGLTAFFSFGPGLLASRGMSGLEAAAVTSLPLWIAILSMPLGSYMLQRLPRPRLVECLSYLVSAATLVALCAGASPILACIAFGLAIGAGPGAIMALPSRVLAPAHRATGLGIFGSLFAAIQGVGPWLAGVLAEIAGTPAAALAVAAALFAACLPLTALFERSARRLTASIERLGI
jgi:predicted MFS family arabinose efflux permease